MADTVGVTAKDFDDFRAKVADADARLQAKIDAILQDIHAVWYRRVLDTRVNPETLFSE